MIAQPNLAFAWFKDRYPGTKALDESKELLKTKISEILSIVKYFMQVLLMVNNSYAANEHLLPIQAKNAGRKLE